MNLLKALAAVSSLTLVSRILAFARDVLMARIFGAGMATDAFFVAEMAAELFGKSMIDDAGHFIYDADNKCRLFTITEAQQQALEIYEFFEKHFGEAK